MPSVLLHRKITTSCARWSDSSDAGSCERKRKASTMARPRLREKRDGAANPAGLNRRRSSHAYPEILPEEVERQLIAATGVPVTPPPRISGRGGDLIGGIADSPEKIGWSRAIPKMLNLSRLGSGG